MSNVDYPRTSDDAKAPALFYGLALSPDGKKLYVSDGAHDPSYGSEPDQSKHYNVVEVYDVAGSPPQLTKSDEIHLMFVGAPVPQARMPTGLALSSDGNTLYVACQLDGTLAIVDLKPGGTQYMELGRTMPLGTGPYDVALDEASQTAFVSLWGGFFVSVGSSRTASCRSTCPIRWRRRRARSFAPTSRPSRRSSSAARSTSPMPTAIRWRRSIRPRRWRR